MLTDVTPLRLTQRDAPFDDPDWVFELKYDGFRALAYVDGGGCRLVSRNRHRFDEFEPLAHGVAKSLRAERAVVDGETVCVDEHALRSRSECSRRSSPSTHRRSNAKKHGWQRRAMSG